MELFTLLSAKFPECNITSYVREMIYPFIFIFNGKRTSMQNKK